MAWCSTTTPPDELAEVYQLHQRQPDWLLYLITRISVFAERHFDLEDPCMGGACNLIERISADIPFDEPYGPPVEEAVAAAKRLRVSLRY